MYDCGLAFLNACGPYMPVLRVTSLSLGKLYDIVWNDCMVALGPCTTPNFNQGVPQGQLMHKHQRFKLAGAPVGSNLDRNTNARIRMFQVAG